MFSKLPDEYMENEDLKIQMDELGDKIETYHNSQENTNALYDDLCNIIRSENEKYVKKNKRNEDRTGKPFWCEELTVFWKAMKTKEKAYLKCYKYLKVKRNLRNKFKEGRKEFHKA